MNLYFTSEIRYCLDLFGMPMAVKTCYSYLCNDGVQFQMEMGKISRPCPRFVDNTELGHFTLGSLSKPRRRRRRERHQTKDLMSKTIAVHVHYKSLYISLPSSAKQEREMTKFCLVHGTRTTMANFSYFRLE